MTDPTDNDIHISLSFTLDAGDQQHTETFDATTPREPNPTPSRGLTKYARNRRVRSVIKGLADNATSRVIDLKVYEKFAAPAGTAYVSITIVEGGKTRVFNDHVTINSELFDPAVKLIDAHAEVICATIASVASMQTGNHSLHPEVGDSRPAWRRILGIPG